MFVALKERQRDLSLKRIHYEFQQVTSSLHYAEKVEKLEPQSDWTLYVIEENFLENSRYVPKPRSPGVYFRKSLKIFGAARDSNPNCQPTTPPFPHATHNAF